MPEKPALVRFFEGLVKRPIAVLMAIVALACTGLIAASRIPIELMPEGFADNTIVVNAPWNGANPLELEKQVVRPLEEEVRTIRGVQKVRSFASPGNCSVIVNFPGTMDMDMAYAEVADRVERVRPNLPREVDRVFVRRWTTSDLPIMWCGIMYPPEIAEFAQDTLAEILKPRIEAVDGIANVNLHGLAPASVRIWLDEDRVRAAGIDLGELVGRLQQDNLSLPVGDLDEAGLRFIVRVDSRFESLEDIENFPIRRGLRIKDVGRVVEIRDDEDGRFRVDGQYSMAMAVTKESSANTVEVCQRLQDFIDEELPDDPILGQFEFQVFWNSGDTVKNSLGDLVQNAGIGGLIACAVLMLFLWRVRYTLLIAASIPFSVVVTLTYMYFTGDSFNLFTMMGITISIGMLVDNSVVIVESIFARREAGDSMDEAVTRGPSEVMLAVVTASLTSVVVFLPLIFMSESRNAKIFASSIGVPLCVSLLAALFLAIIIVPVASRYLTRDTAAHDPGQHAVSGPFRLLARGMDRSLHLAQERLARLVGWSLHNRFLTVAISVLFIGSCQVASFENQVQPSLSGFGGQFQVRFEFAANTTLEDGEREVFQMEDALFAHRDELGDPVIGIGYSRRGGEINCWFESDLTPDEDRAIKERMQALLPPRSAVEYKFEQFDVQAAAETAEKWARVHIEGPESVEVARLAEQVRARARLDPAFAEVAEQDDPTREVVVSLDREQMQRAGVNSQRLLGTVEWALRGVMVSRLETNRGDIPILIEYDEEVENPSRARLSELTVAAFENGASLPLSAMLSRMEFRRGLRSIYREDGRTSEVVGLRTEDEDLRSSAAAIETLMAGVDMPEGYRWRQTGGLDEFNDDMTEMLKAFGLAVALVFFLMGLLFESILLPFSVLVTIPFAVAGAVWSFWLAGEPMDIIGMVGLIVLAGVVVNNGIVLLDRIIRLQGDGLSRRDAILQGVRDRLRPVAMTALTTIVGLMPIALASPSGDGFSFKGLAIGVAGGLACSTFFTLWVVPVAYSLFDDLSRWLRDLLGFPRFLRRWLDRRSRSIHPARV